MADKFQTGGVHNPGKFDTGDGQIVTHGLDEAAQGTNTGSPLDDKGNISNK
jgi:hypothetical protein